MPSAWVEHVKNFAIKYNIKYPCAISNEQCKLEYQMIKYPHKFPKQIEKRVQKNENNAADLIHRFIKNKRAKITALYLNAICSESGVCIAFGKEVNKIKYFFNYFTNFMYVNKYKKIGETGQNGSVYEIEYDRLNYKAYAVLKKSIYERSDNLLYEYLVGLFINNYYKKYPCFVETYGIYNEVQSSNPFNLKRDLNLLKIENKTEIINSLPFACQQPLKLALLIEHFQLAHTMGHLINNSPNFFKNHILHILFQIYMPLNALSDIFTHYDLHYNNVLLYTPSGYNYIHYHYHLNNTTVSFKSVFIAKIIDYGRSYFNNKKIGINSFDIYSSLDQNPDCRDFAHRGFGWLEPKNYQLNNSNYYTNVSIPNRSHDLRLLYMMKDKYNPALYENEFNDQVQQMIKVLFTKVNYKTKAGTRELVLSSTLDKNKLPRKINHIRDVFELLTKICMSDDMIDYNDSLYVHQTKVGDMHIYTDGKDINFIPC